MKQMLDDGGLTGTEGKSKSKSLGRNGPSSKGLGSKGPGSH